MSDFMIGTVLILLNYNNYEETIKFLEMVKNYQSVNKIVVVDNASTNDSFIQLQKYESKKVTVIQSPNNEGYASGNNFGVRYAEKHYPSKRYIISNPDVIVTDKTIKELNDFCDKFKEEKKLGIVAPVMLNPGEAVNKKNTGWKLPTWKSDVISMFTLLSRIFSNPLEYEKPNEEASYQQVDVLPGSFFMISAESFRQVGYFDERTFLFCEERILAYKLRSKDYQNYILFDSHYVHNHSTTIKSNISKINTYKILLESKQIYQNHYVENSNFRKRIFLLFCKLSMIEKKILYRIKN